MKATGQQQHRSSNPLLPTATGIHRLTLSVLSTPMALETMNADSKSLQADRVTSILQETLRLVSDDSDLIDDHQLSEASIMTPTDPRE